ncbi:MAG: hypothetical protein V4795_14175 [Pseudomonadota bacterium]
MTQWMTPQARHGARWSALALATLVLVGCGGGGGGGGGGAVVNPPVVNPPVVPTAQFSSDRLNRLGAPVQAVATDIDDGGRVAVLFAQSDGNRVALQAVRGVPNARGAAPTFSAPEVIDTLAPYDSSLGETAMGLTLSPNGNALARWIATAPCVGAAGNCKFVYTARRMNGAAATWEDPVLAGEANTLPRGIINDVGDIALLWPTQQNNANGVQILGMVWKKFDDTQFTAPTVFPDILAPASSSVAFTLDGHGNMVYVSLSTTTGTPMLVASRGTVSTGFAGNAEPIGSPATQATGEAALESISGGVNGQVVVTWTQPKGSRLRAAALDSFAGSWQEVELDASRNSQQVRAAVAGNGDYFRYELDTCRASLRRNGSWQDGVVLPPGTCATSARALARRGNLLGARLGDSSAAGGQWLHYDVAQNALTQSLSTAASGYLFGTPSSVDGALLLSENGVAALVSRNGYDVLPTAAATAGTRGIAYNVWVTYVKLP